MAFGIKVPPKVKSQLRKLKPVAKHHYFIVTILLFGGVAAVIYSVNQTLAAPTDDAYRSERLQSTIGSKFNKNARDTIEKIKALQKSTDTAVPEANFPAGRINPFAE
ncbi:MAG TPA: hypothetical protein VJM32_00660 [Candidatus Saccharimonadales bacterium]|nr:hypothetical protein [Candidatus Saccharimonadales bacterium]